MHLHMSYRNKILIWIGLTILALLGSIFGVIIPAIQALRTTKLHIETVEQQVQSNEMDLQKTIINQKHAPEIERTLTTLQTAYITTDNPIDFISRLEQLADQHHVVLNFNLNTEVADATTVPITLHLTGTLSDCLAYVNDVLHDAVYITITELTIESAATEVSSADQMSVTVQALTYWQ